MKRRRNGVSSMLFRRIGHSDFAENAGASGRVDTTEEIVVKYFEKTIFCAFHCYCFVVE
ncbi:MAG: hypothetical protein J6Y20_13435 [Lachnospiraceae bacterium]|nr:hypothetical protein [Lachnospiraceae bacterium]